MQHEENLKEVEKLQGEKTTLEKEIAELVDRRLAEETTCHLAVGLFDTARNQRVQVRQQR